MWFKHLWKGEADRYVWNKSESHSFLARQASLFHKHKPVVSYGDDELDHPLHGGTVSMWEMCAGLLGHVHFTIPLIQNSKGQYVPTTLQAATSTYSPYAESETPNITALEDFMIRITRDAFSHSPFYRHYGMHHLASNSASCGEYASTINNTVPRGSQYTFAAATETGHGVAGNLTGNFSFPMISKKGVLYGLLGTAARHSCFCGFDFDNGQCVLPPNILEYIIQTRLPSTADMIYLFSEIASFQKGRFFLSQNERVQRTLKVLWKPTWQCPELEPSDQWGIIKNTSAWMQSREGSTIHANDLFETGSAGPLRAGTIGNILTQSTEHITPMSRIGTMNPFDASPITGMWWCHCLYLFFTIAFSNIRTHRSYQMRDLMVGL